MDGRGGMGEEVLSFEFWVRGKRLTERAGRVRLAKKF